jgi:hypothetical protein
MEHRIEITGDNIEFVRHIMDCHAYQERLNGGSYVVDVAVSVEDDGKEYLCYKTKYGSMYE